MCHHRCKESVCGWAESNPGGKKSEDTGPQGRESEGLTRVVHVVGAAVVQRWVRQEPIMTQDCPDARLSFRLC